MEARFGVSFASVRLHDDTQARSSAVAMNARAFTFGEHIVSGPGGLRSETGAGRTLLAHELAHVVQQRRGATGGGAASPLAAERDAERAASAVAAGGAPRVATRVRPRIQRQDAAMAALARNQVTVETRGSVDVVSINGIPTFRVFGRTGRKSRRVAAGQGRYRRLRRPRSRNGNSVSWRWVVPLTYAEPVLTQPLAGLTQLEAMRPSVDFSLDVRTVTQPSPAKGDETDAGPPSAAGETDRPAATAVRPKGSAAPSGPLSSLQLSLASALDRRSHAAETASTEGPATAAGPRTFTPRPDVLFPQLLGQKEYDRFRRDAQRLKKQYPQLTEAEIIAVRAYTAEHYKKFNEPLRNPTKANRHHIPLVSAAWDAMLKLPRHQSTEILNRTTPMSQQMWEELFPNQAGRFVDRAFMSTSRGQTPGTKEGVVLFRVQGFSGRQLGSLALHSEREILFPPGTSFHYERQTWREMFGLGKGKEKSRSFTDGPVRLTELQGPAQTPVSDLFFQHRPIDSAPPTSQTLDGKKAPVRMASRPALSMDASRPAKAEAVGTVLLAGANALLGYAATRVQRAKLEQELKARRGDMEQQLRATKKGLWVHYVFTTVEAHPDSMITPSARFQGLHIAHGTRSQRRETQPPSATSTSTSTQVHSVWMPPLAPSVRAQLSELWLTYHTYERAARQMSREGTVGRFFLERQGRLDRGPLFDARAHLVSARIAVQQGRLAAAKRSADLAAARLEQMRKSFTNYGVDWKQ